MTRQYVLGLEAVLPTGEIVRTGGRVVKNVVGYDLTQLLVGSEGTLAIVTEITLRLIPLPPAAATLRATFASVDDAVSAVIHLIRERVVPSTMELVDRDSLEAVAAALETQALAPEGTGALLIIEVDGLPEQVAAEAERVVRSCLAARATEVLRARHARRAPGTLAGQARDLRVADAHRAAQVQSRHRRPEIEDRRPDEAR